MSNLQFWKSSELFDNNAITIYYLPENNMRLFVASDIFSIIDAFNEDVDDKKNAICKPTTKNKIYVFQNDLWQNIDVFEKEEILNAIKSSDSEKVRFFEEWLKNLCSNIPEGCILPKDSKEYEFLNLATNRFMELYEEINNCSFMDLTPEIRLYKIKDFFSVYSEMLSYASIKDYIEIVENTRPPMESVISSDLVKFVRNILAHFPFFTSWDEIYISKQLVNWASEGKSIDRFLKKYQGHKEVEYRFKERLSDKWRYPTIKFPSTYNEDKIYLKDMITERDGVLLCALLMYKVVSSQIINPSNLQI